MCKAMSEITFVNLTTNVIQVFGKTTDDLILIVERGGDPAYAPFSTIYKQEIGGVPFVGQGYEETVGIPDPIPGTIYIVSQIAAQHAPPGRNDVVYPTHLVKDENGSVIGCRAFGHYGAENPWRIRRGFEDLP